MIITALPAGRLRLALSQSSTIAAAACGAGVVDVEAIVGLILGERGAGFAVSHLLPGPSLPLVIGAVDLGQLGAGNAILQLLEQPAGADRPQLRGVAGEHELAVRVCAVSSVSRDEALGVGHPRLVHDHDGPGAKAGCGRSRRRCRDRRR